MVRKVIVTMILCVIMCVSTITPALAYTSYDDGNISTTYTTYYEDIVDGLPYGFSYVFSRTGQYEYILHASDNLKHENGVFTSVDGMTYKITTSSGYNSTYRYKVLNESNFTLDSNDTLVYSNLGNYPLLDDRGSIYEISILFAFIVCLLCCLIRPFFKFVLRIR